MNDRGPIKNFRAESVQAAVWKNESHDGRPYYSATFERRYKDKQSDEWRSSKSLMRSDLLALAELARNAYAWIRDAEESERSRNRSSPVSVSEAAETSF